MYRGEWTERTRSGGETDTEARVADLAYAYQHRFKAVIDANREFYLSRLDAEVLWGNDLSKMCQEVQVHAHELQSTIQLYLIKQGEGARLSQQPPLQKDHEAIIYRGLGGDKFGEGLKASVAKLEDRLRPHFRW